MGRLIKFIAMILLGAFSLSAFSRSAVPVIDYIDVPVMTSSGKQVTPGQVRDAIVSAAQNRGWEITRSSSQDMLSATIIVRGKHMVMVTIPFSGEKFSIKYENSSNMKYSVQDGSTTAGNAYNTQPNGAGAVRVIHPYYNNWVQQLLQDIQNELRKL